MPDPQERLLTGAVPPCAGTSLAQEVLQRFGRVRFRATGSSMLPAVAPGDVLTFRAAQPQDLQPGHIVLVHDRDRLLAHRLLAHEHGMLVTRGDSLHATDMPACATRLLGVLDAHERGERPLPVDRDHHRMLPRTSRWLMRNVPLAHRIARRWPRLTALTA